MNPKGQGSSRRLRWGLVAASTAAGALLGAVVAGGSPLPGDVVWLRDLAASRTEAATTVAWTVTQLGALWTLTGITLGAAVALWWVSRRASLFVVASALGSGVLNEGLKLLIGRPRPPPAIVHAIYHPGGYSFPSGHAMVTASLFLAFFLVTRRLRPSLQWWALAVGAGLSAAVGLTRMYLGVHYPSDVLGGWLLGIGWVVLQYGWYLAGPGGGAPVPAGESPARAPREEQELTERTPHPTQEHPSP